MILAQLVLASALERPELLAVRCERIADGAALKVLATAPIEDVTNEKSGDAFVLLLPASLGPEPLALPEPIAPIQSLALEQSRGLARLRVSVAPDAQLDFRAEGSLLTFSFRAAGAEAVAAARDVEQLYALLFPQAGERPMRLEAPPASEPEGSSGGFRVGSVMVRPSLAIRYVNAESAYLDTPVPVPVSYLEVQPQVQVTSELAGGQLSVMYGPRFRRGEDTIPVLREPSHFLNAGFDRPLGASLHLVLSDQYVRGAIETSVVDPGREYFYDLGRFERNQVGFTLRKETGGRLGMFLNGSLAKETVDPGSGYFSNERQGVGAGLSYELTPLLRASLGYHFDRVPPPAERPIVESSGHSVSVGLDGDIGASWSGGLSAGYRLQHNPQAPPGGDRYEGLVVTASLRRTFVHSAALALNASRSTQLSAFESNSFYVADSVSAQLTWPLPHDFQLVGGAGYHWNDYRLDAAGLGEPRHDRLFGWNVGLGRVLTTWSSLRVDYAADRRESNVPSLSSRAHSLVVHLTLAANGSR